jgi:hypothetical protein
MGNLKLWFILVSFVILDACGKVPEAEYRSPLDYLIDDTIYAAGVETDSAIYLAGGYNSAGAISTFYEIDPGFQVIRTAQLSEARGELSAEFLSETLVFAGGQVTSPAPAATDRVDIVNLLGWFTQTISVARYSMSSTVLDNNAFFAGGVTDATPTASNVVDIYNVTTDIWSAEVLSQARFGMGATAIGGFVFFGGGREVIAAVNTPYDIVDVYEVATDTWTVENLSVPRYNLAAVSFTDDGGDQLVMFAGGNTGMARSNVVDIFDVEAGTWETAALSVARDEVEATVVDGKIYISGGFTADGVASNVIDVYDISEGLWTTLTMPEARARHQMLATKGLISFVGGMKDATTYIRRIDVLNTVTQKFIR